MLKACIIGTGRIASLLEKDPLRPKGCTHAGAYAQHPEIELAAGADVDPEALTAFGKDWGLPVERLYSDYRRLLSEDRYDIASICAYAPQRVEMVEAALQSGVKGLWLEKALGCSLQEAERIARLVTKSKAAAVVDYPRRARAPFRTIKQIIEEKRFGALQSVTCHMTHQLIHTGTHAFDVLRYWCGEATEVSGRLQNEPDPSSPIQDDGGDACIRFSSGAVAFVSAYRKKYYIFQFDLIFENARILIGNDISKVYLPDTSRLYTGFKELFESNAVAWDQYYHRDMVDELAHCMRTGEPPLFSIDNAIEALRIALAIFESHRQGGRAVSPADVDPTLHVENR